MPKVLAFHFIEKDRLPKSSNEELKDIMNKLYDVLKDYPDVRFNGTYVNEESRGYAIGTPQTRRLLRDGQEGPGGEAIRSGDSG